MFLIKSISDSEDELDETNIHKRWVISPESAPKKTWDIFVSM